MPAWLLARMGRHGEAAPIAGEVVDILRDIHGPRDLQVARMLADQAALLRVSGRWDETLPIRREVHDIFQEELGPIDYRTHNALYELARVLSELGRHDEALHLLEDVLEHGQLIFGTDSLFFANTQRVVANLLVATGQPDQAEPLYRAAIRTMLARFGPDFSGVEPAFDALIALLIEQARHAEAEQAYLEVLEIERGSPGRRWALAQRLAGYAGLLRETGRADEATGLLLEAVSLARSRRGDRDRDTHVMVKTTLDHLRRHAPAHPELPALASAFPWL